MPQPRPDLDIRLRSWLFFLLYNLMGIVHSVLCLLVAPFQSFEQRYRFVNLWTRATLWLLRTLNGIDVRVEGLEHIPQDEPVVIMSNHQSEWETFYLQLLVSPQATVVKRELLGIPFFGWGLALLKPIAIDRGSPAAALKTILKTGKERLDEGISVVIYPEGARQLPGQLGRFNAGGAMLACRAGRRVLPVAHNAGDCWPHRSLLRHPGTIHLRIGPPMACEDGDVKALNARVEQWIRENAAELMQPRPGK
ncbi:lysophospholipid acyltransferase family protein [Ectothiorhodospira shaposhnikovii]|uniref:lysophospholipid acyltransferase family protein n=1 Tax=Ectothiorhodospira shaposhnikovii TaxID=1054 RepID=UPI001EE95F19|nr:lysophospholipid acyltransferase family protein [Ectothiorhodospira shaposhnikovii]MCG5514408.1 1-acyl-sn-glycerol-3-phosphate acyltransferase [Ectothiorhodospira shaposhnikovii]